MFIDGYKQAQVDSRVGSCECCEDHEGHYVIDPYVEEMEGRVVVRCLCRECYEAECEGV